MISFIKKLFGFGSVASPKAAPQLAPYKIEPKSTAIYVESATPVIKSETVPAKKNRRPRNRNKVKAGDAVAKLAEGNNKGAVNTQAPAKVAPVKSTKPKQSAKSK